MKKEDVCETGKLENRIFWSFSVGEKVRRERERERELKMSTEPLMVPKTSGYSDGTSRSDGTSHHSNF